MGKADEINSVIAYLAESLDKAQTIDELIWDLSKKCIANLNFEDCVIYLIDRDNETLYQKAALGPKSPGENVIYNPITIPIGKGIVGSVALNGIAEMIGDTSKDPRYIVDDKRRYSELAVPIKYHDYVIGVIDSEHSRKDFFTKDHLHILTVIATFAANKIREINHRDTHRNNPTGTHNLLDKLKQFERNENDHIVLNTQARTYKLNKSEIIRAEADGNYCVVFTNSGLKIMLAKTLKNFEKELDSRQFIRPHKSHLINSRYITSHVQNELFLTDNTCIQISVRKQVMIRRLLGVK